MFILKNTNGTAHPMKSGEPFRYTTRELARLGKAILEGKEKVTLTVVEEI